MAVSISVTKLARDKKRWYFSFYYDGKKYKKEVWKGEPMLSKAEALKCAYELIEQLDHAKNFGKDNMTLYELYDDYVLHTKHSLKISTTTKYQTFKKCYLSLIDDMQIKNLSSKDILEWKNKILKLKLSIVYKNRILNIFKSVLDYGVKVYSIQGNLQISLLDKVKENNVIIKDNRTEFILENDFIYFCSFLDLNKKSDYYYYVIFNIMYYTGIRIGELAALTINDFYDSLIDIHQDYIRINGNDIIQAPKNENSVRKILLDPVTNELLLDYIKKFNPTNILFRQKGKYLNQNKVRRKIESLAKISELDQKYYMHPHGFRKSHASNLRLLGFDIFAIAERLGNTPDIAASTYTKTKRNEQAEMVKNLRK